MVGNGGKAQSRLDESGSGDGRPCGIGAVTLRRGLPNGDCDLSFGVKGETLRDGEELAGVSCSDGKKGRSSLHVSMGHYLMPKLTYSQQKHQLSVASPSLA